MLCHIVLCCVGTDIRHQHRPFGLQGWIPRSGLQYGTDLVLYEQHPSLVHSTVCVIIVPMSHAGVNQGPCDPRLVLDGQDGSLSWHDVEGINRLCIRVSNRTKALWSCLSSCGKCGNVLAQLVLSAAKQVKSASSAGRSSTCMSITCTHQASFGQQGTSIYLGLHQDECVSKPTFGVPKYLNWIINLRSCCAGWQEADATLHSTTVC